MMAKCYKRTVTTKMWGGMQSLIEGSKCRKSTTGFATDVS